MTDTPTTAPGQPATTGLPDWIHKGVRDHSVPAPGERCGELKPSIIDKQRTECVLRPGHNGSHADEHGTRWRMLPDAPDVDLREQIVDALRTTPATGHTHKPGEEKWDHHPKPGEQGHNYTYTCALCRGDIDALADAVMPVATGHMVRVTGELRTRTQRLEQAVRDMADDSTPDDGLREQYAAALYGRNNPGFRWEAAHPHDRDVYRADAAAVLAVRDRCMKQLRDEVERMKLLVAASSEPGHAVRMAAEHALCGKRMEQMRAELADQRAYERRLREQHDHDVAELNRLRSRAAELERTKNQRDNLHRHLDRCARLNKELADGNTTVNGKLLARAERAEAAIARIQDAAALHRRQLIRTAELYAVIAAATDDTVPAVPARDDQPSGQARTLGCGWCTPGDPPHPECGTHNPGTYQAEDVPAHDHPRGSAIPATSEPPCWPYEYTDTDGDTLIIDTLIIADGTIPPRIYVGIQDRHGGESGVYVHPEDAEDVIAAIRDTKAHLTSS